MKCQAVVDDWEHLAVYAPMQRVTAPGSKGCSRTARVKIGQLCLCQTHARLAKEGFISEGGVMADRRDIQVVRKYNKPPLYSWAEKLPVEPLSG